MNNLIYKTILNFILLFSIFSIAFAYYVEFILGHQPCNLCLLERIPYLLTIVIIVILLIFKNFERYTFLVIAVIFFSATLLSVYHVGIEKEFFEESAVCSSDLKILDKEKLLKELTKKVVSCKNVTFSIFGLSLATINTFVSFIISAITFRIFLNYENK